MLKTAVCWWWLWICEGGKLDCRSGTRRLGRGAFAAVLEPFSKHSSLIDQLADTYQDLQLRASAIQSCGGVFVRDKQKSAEKPKKFSYLPCVSFAHVRLQSAAHLLLHMPPADSINYTAVYTCRLVVIE